MGWAPHLRNAAGDTLGKVVADHGLFTGCGGRGAGGGLALPPPSVAG
ncbi:hypothetical protein KPP03845_100050 [Streptomyces xanthophaeus]|nr:hypothetical protein KPP03845_100050 [Streptomyces xanthophaeus]